MKLRSMVLLCQRFEITIFISGFLNPGLPEILNCGVSSTHLALVLAPVSMRSVIYCYRFEKTRKEGLGERFKGIRGERIIAEIFMLEIKVPGRHRS